MNGTVTTLKPASSERQANALNGWFMLCFNLVLLIGSVTWLIWVIVQAARTDINHGFILLLLAPAFTIVVAIIMLTGHFTLQPNQARVMILFGAYKGTVRSSGFWWMNPFYARARSSSAVPTKIEKISLRNRNFNSEKLKVNDKRGNPIEIAAVIVWRVEDTARAAFDVDNYETYVHIQSESAIRHIASLFAYDHGDEHEPTLRESADEIGNALKKELLERLHSAGVVIEEARLTHLAYAPEIAQAMLRRQQAEAVIAARQKIVHGAVSMVDMALKEIAEKAVVNLDDERKAAMVSNLLVVLCGETEASPVINTGTLYS